MMYWERRILFQTDLSAPNEIKQCGIQWLGQDEPTLVAKVSSEGLLLTSELRPQSWVGGACAYSGKMDSVCAKSWKALGLQKERTKTRPALAGVAQGIEHSLPTKGSLVWFSVRAYAWVVGQDPSGGHTRGNHTFMFLSLSLSIPSPYSKRKK